jgi:hypothetical protein
MRIELVCFDLFAVSLHGLFKHRAEPEGGLLLLSNPPLYYSPGFVFRRRNRAIPASTAARGFV